MTQVNVPPGNLSVTQAVISVPLGSDGNNPASPLNPPTAPANSSVTDSAAIDQLREINHRLGALLILLTNAYGLRDDPNQLNAASRALSSSYTPN